MNFEVQQLLFIFVFMVGLAIYAWFSWVKPWRIKKRMLDAINEKYEHLRTIRRDIVYHYYWALERDEPEQAASHEAHACETDKELEHLRDLYLRIEKLPLNHIHRLRCASSEPEDKFNKRIPSIPPDLYNKVIFSKSYELLNASSLGAETPSHDSVTTRTGRDSFRSRKTTLAAD